MSSSDMDSGFGGSAVGPDSGGRVGSDTHGRHGVVHVEGLKRDYAVGLLWNSVENASNAAKEARAMAGTAGMDSDFYCVRIEGVPQYGLGSQEIGHKAGMPSLAAHAASNKGGSWLGAFPVRDGFYLLAVKDDAVLSEYDRFYPSEDEARSAFWDLHQAERWPESFAPTSWGIEDAEDRAIEDFLLGRPPAKLIGVSSSGKLLKIGLVVTVVGAAAFGGYSYIEHQREMEEQARIQEMLRLAEERSRAAAENAAVVVPPPPWEGQPAGTAFLEACADGMRKIGFGTAGWKLTGLSCSEGAVSAELTRAGGTINWVAATLNDGDFRPSIFPTSETTVVASWAMAEMPVHPKEIEAVTLVDVRRYLLSGFEETFTPITFEVGAATDFYAGLIFTFETGVPPLSYAPILNRIPGLVVTAVALNPDTSIWTVKGQVHEQLPPPPSPTGQ